MGTLGLLGLCLLSVLLSSAGECAIGEADDAPECDASVEGSGRGEEKNEADHLRREVPRKCGVDDAKDLGIRRLEKEHHEAREGQVIHLMEV